MSVDPVFVGVGGVFGAIARHAVTQRVESRSFPASTFLVNVLGSFLLGVVAFAGASDRVTLLVGVGACGSFTTFSSFSFETVRLWEAGDRTLAAVNAAGTLLGAVLAIGAARTVVILVIGG